MKCKIRDCNNDKAVLLPIRLPFCEQHMGLIEPGLKQKFISSLCLYDAQTKQGTATPAQTKIMEDDIYYYFSRVLNQLQKALYD